MSRKDGREEGAGKQGKPHQTTLANASREYSSCTTWGGCSQNRLLPLTAHPRLSTATKHRRLLALPARACSWPCRSWGPESGQGGESQFSLGRQNNGLLMHGFSGVGTRPSSELCFRKVCPTVQNLKAVNACNRPLLQAHGFAPLRCVLRFSV